MERSQPRTDDVSQEIVDGLRERLNALGERHDDRIAVTVGQTWIGFRSQKHGRVFAEVRPHRTRVEIFILPPKRELKDPRGLAQAAPRSQGWGWFRSRLSVATRGQIDPAYQLLRQSYERSIRPPNGGATNHRRHRRGQIAL